MLMTQYGNTVNPETTVYDTVSGQIIGAHCRRFVDGKVRYYRIDQLRHVDGLNGVIACLEAAPKKITE